MKLVREHINEKFTDDDDFDPIHSMRIGLNFSSKEELTTWLMDNLTTMIQTTEIPKDILYPDEYNVNMVSEYRHKIEYYLKHNLSGNKIKLNHNELDGWDVYDIIQKELRKMGYPKVPYSKKWGIPKEVFRDKIRNWKDPDELVREHINEKFTEDGDPIRDMGIGIGNLVPLNSKFPVSEYNTYYNELRKLVKRGFIIGIFIKNETMMDIYKKLSDLIVPFFQNSSLYSNDNNGIYYGEADDINTKNKGSIFKIIHMCTNGRYDINSSVTWCMTNKEKEIVKNVYKGHNNDEYPFYLMSSKYHISFIISKSGKFVTLVFEGECPLKLKQYFLKIPQFNDYYLKDSWISPSEAVDLIKMFVNNL
jgi:hypothetical protein